MKLIDKLFPKITATADMGWAEYERRNLDSLREESLAFVKQRKMEAEKKKEKKKR